MQPEDREDQDLRDDRDAVADDHIGDGFDQRHGARLFHAGVPSSIGQQFSCESSQRMRCNQTATANTLIGVATEAVAGGAGARPCEVLSRGGDAAINLVTMPVMALCEGTAFLSLTFLDAF